MVRTICKAEKEQITLPIPKDYIGTTVEEQEPKPVFGCAKGQFWIAELEQSLLSFLNYEYKNEHSKQIKILFDDKNCISEMCDEKGKCEPCIDGECPNDCKSKSKCFSYKHYNFDACGGTDIKNNFSIKNCPEGSVWTYNFCEPAGEEPYYSIPENTDCKNITPKRVKNNTTRKSKF